MIDKDLQDLKAAADALKNPSVDVRVRRASLSEIVGESYLEELAAMGESEAIQHLRATSGEKLLHAYLVLSSRPQYALRANHPILAEVCLRFMGSSKESDRAMGAGNLGAWLVGTNDKNASHALALMICNSEETGAVKSEAYTSLQLINNKATVLEIVRWGRQPKESRLDIVGEIDWAFVRSFLD